jgi:hypothetical protein
MQSVRMDRRSCRSGKRALPLTRSAAAGWRKCRRYSLHRLARGDLDEAPPTAIRTLERSVLLLA